MIHVLLIKSFFFGNLELEIANSSNYEDSSMLAHWTKQSLVLGACDLTLSPVSEYSKTFSTTRLKLAQLSL